MRLLSMVTLLCFSFAAYPDPVIYINQIGFDSKSPKIAIIKTDNKLSENTTFNLINTATGKTVFTGKLNKPQSIDEWAKGKLFYNADFSFFKSEGNYQLTVSVSGTTYKSANFVIEENALAKHTISIYCTLLSPAKS
jgi:hypothetical protein